MSLPTERRLPLGNCRELDALLEVDPSGYLVSVSLPSFPHPGLLTQISKDLYRQALQILSRFPIHPPSNPKVVLFQEALCAIPPGSTKTYGDIAKQLDTSPRAIGAWCASNPLLLKVPCHRIVSKSGLGGFHPGRPWKELLQMLEQSRSSIRDSSHARPT